MSTAYSHSKLFLSMSAMLRRIRVLTPHAGGNMRVSEIRSTISHHMPQVPLPKADEAD
jgi:hypothetical protein